MGYVSSDERDIRGAKVDPSLNIQENSPTPPSVPRSSNTVSYSIPSSSLKYSFVTITNHYHSDPLKTQCRAKQQQQSPTPRAFSPLKYVPPSLFPPSSPTLIPYSLTHSHPLIRISSTLLTTAPLDRLKQAATCPPAASPRALNPPALATLTLARRVRGRVALVGGLVREGRVRVRVRVLGVVLAPGRRSDLFLCSCRFVLCS